MAVKLLNLFLIAAVVSQGFCLTEITLPEESTTFVTNDLIPKTISIPKSFLDTLESCFVIYPSGIMYEVYPENSIPDDNVFALEAVPPFNACGIGFRGVPVSFSGTYELLSHVTHSLDESETLTRKQFHLTFIESESA